MKTSALHFAGFAAAAATGLAIASNFQAGSSTSSASTKATSGRSSPPAQVSASAKARERMERDRAFEKAVDAARFADAKAMIVEDLAGATETTDSLLRVEVHRRMARVLRAEGDINGAERSLEVAMQQLRVETPVKTEMPQMRALILMDQADLAAFGKKNADAAIALYDMAAAEFAKLPKSRHAPRGAKGLQGCHSPG